MIKLTEDQKKGAKAVVDGIKEKGYAVLCGYAGTGKALWDEESIPYFSHGEIHFKKNKDIKVGDILLSYGNDLTKVTGVFPQGELEAYKVNFSNDSSVVCNGEHLWSYFSSEDELTTKTLLDLFEEYTEIEIPVVDFKKTKIVSIEKLPKKLPMTCLEVEHPTHLYAFGNKLTLTHNTTTIKTIISEYLDIDEDKVLACAPTGVASFRLREQGWKNSSTVHQSLYNYKVLEDFDDEGNTITIFDRQVIDEEELKENYDIILVDEAGMLEKELYEDLMKLDIPKIFIGDPAQLPPVGNPTDLLDSPDYTLTKPVRQTEDSDILEIATNLREGEKIFIKNYSDVLIDGIKNINTEYLLRADQVICSTNKTKDKINDFFRKEKGINSKLPVLGDRVIFLENKWEIKDNNNNPVVNGLQGVITDINSSYTTKTGKRGVNKDKVMMFTEATITTDYGEFKDILIDVRPFIEGQYSEIHLKKMKKRKKMTPIMQLCKIDFSYCLTVHKMQGAEKNKIVIIEEQFPYKKEESYKSLYTALTRAKEKAIIYPCPAKIGQYIGDIQKII